MGRRKALAGRLTTPTGKKPRFVPLDEINAAAAVQIRSQLNQEAIEQYKDILDQMPPIDLFLTKTHGLVLADGFHRVEAARRVDRNELRAIITEGTLGDAMEWAVIANLKHGQPLRRGERHEAIVRLKRLHPGWSGVKIAKAMGISGAAVSDALSTAQIRKEVVGKTPLVRDSDLKYIKTTPKAMWTPLIKAVEKRKWGSDEVRLVVKNIRSPKVPEDFKQALVAGEVDPVVFSNGEPGFLPASVARMIRKEVADDTTVALLKMEESLARIRALPLDKIVEALDREHADRLLKDIPSFVATLDAIYEELKGLVVLKEVQ